MYNVFDTPDAVPRYTAQRVLATIQATPSAVLGLATGSTMEPVYAHFLQLLQHKPVNLSQVSTFNLDEYIGLSAAHAQSYNYYMREHLFSKLSLPAERVHLPDGMASNIEDACQAYSEAIKAIGGLDLQL